MPTEYEIAAPRHASCAMLVRLKPCAASGPKRTMMPTNPSAMPAILLDEKRSSAVEKCATIAVKIGIVAFKIDARPLEIRVSPHAISKNGIALFVKPRTANGTQSSARDG